MNIKQITAVLCLLGMSLLTPALVQGKTVSGINIADAVTYGDEQLVLNGAGPRTRLVIKVYVAGLYLTRKIEDPQEVISADEPMAIRLYVTSNMLNAKRMKKALLDGFSNATNGETAPIQSGIDQLMGLMSGDIGKNAELTLNYKPGAGTEVYQGEELLDTIEGLPFKQALFGIWLSDKPAQDSLKQELLGK